MKKKNITTRDIANIGLGIAAMISGGFLIVFIGRSIPIPGGKYIVMSPYLSLVIYVILDKVRNTRTLLLTGLTLGSIMAFINVFMGIAILATTLLTHITVVLMRENDRKILLSSILFSTYTGVTSVIISKNLVGGAFELIGNEWIILTGLLCTLMGTIGGVFGKHISRLIK